MASNFSARAITLVASVADGLPALHIQDFREIDKENFAVIFSTSSNAKQFNQEKFHEAIASATDGKLGILNNSLFNIRSQGSNLMRCIVASNREVLPFDEKVMKDRGMKPMLAGASVLEDNNEHIWRIVSNGDQKHIVQVSQENYTDLLDKRRRMTNQLTASASDHFDIGAQDTDFVYFFNHTTQAMDYGFLVETKGAKWVVTKDGDKPVKVEAHQIIEASSTDGKGLNLSQKRREITAAATSSINDWITFLKKLYGANSQYVRDWINAIKNSPALVR